MPQPTRYEEIVRLIGKQPETLSDVLSLMRDYFRVVAMPAETQYRRRATCPVQLAAQLMARFDLKAPENIGYPHLRTLFEKAGLDDKDAASIGKAVRRDCWKTLQESTRDGLIDAEPSALRLLLSETAMLATVRALNLSS